MKYSVYVLVVFILLFGVLTNYLLAKELYINHREISRVLYKEIILDAVVYASIISAGTAIILKRKQQ
ncbi:MAG: hypothetical protein Q4C75_01090 [Bergeyella zoohelcum]|nr:hypothetical protein [Bergeyella zoohelcum]